MPVVLFEVITKILCISYECVSQIGVTFGAEQDENELTITTKRLILRTYPHLVTSSKPCIIYHPDVT